MEKRAWKFKTRLTWYITLACSSSFFSNASILVFSCSMVIPYDPSSPLAAVDVPKPGTRQSEPFIREKVTKETPTSKIAASALASIQCRGADDNLVVEMGVASRLVGRIKVTELK